MLKWISYQVKIKLSKGGLFYLKMRYLCCKFAQGIAAASFFMWYYYREIL
ncbi:MAG: hypothetical protein TRG1_832 [Flavobacteriaceae bacterium FS1-H7996/R]|nr:MAG: hypothetical protein TRG1_832 [Flavobacteriaceae bacterium FS1-H7996/R]